MIKNVVIRAFVLIAILYASVPAIIGCLIKCIANPSLDPKGVWCEWKIAMNPAQSDWCRSVGLGEPEQPHGEILEKISRALLDFTAKEPEFPQCGIITSRKGVAGAPFIPHIDFCLKNRVICKIFHLFS